MKFEPGYLFGMVLQSIPEPRKIAHEIQALRFSRAVLWQTFALFEVLSMTLGVFLSMLYPPGPEVLEMIRETPLLAITTKPILAGIIGASLMVITVFSIYWIGRMFGGTGRFDQAILTVLWLQFVMLILQSAMLVLSLFAAGIAGLLNLFAMFVVFWILSHFITEMHGFKSVGLVFVLILVTIIVAFFGFGIILAMIGIGTITAGSL